MYPIPDYNRLSQFRQLAGGIGGSIPNTGNLPDSVVTPQAKSNLPVGGVLPYTALSNIPKSTINKSKFVTGVRDNQPAIRAAAGLASNLITANKLDDNIDTQVVTNKPFVYKNRSGFLADRNRANFRNFLRNRTGVPVNANQAYAATLNSSNQVAAIEGEREDKAIESYNNRDLQINATNTEAFNRNLYLNNMLTNNKTVQKGTAFTNYLSNLDTQDLQKSNLARDTKALEIMGLGLNYGRADNLLQSVMGLLKK